MKSGIYIITNKKSYRFYIGSSVNARSRLTDHKNLLRKNNHTNRHLQFAWNKYNEECFKFEVLELVAIDKLIQREQFWIDILQACKFGYNIAPKAGCTTGFKHNRETVEKHRVFLKGNNYAKGRKDTEEMKHYKRVKAKELWNNDPQKKEKLSERMKGNKYTLGLKHTERAKALMSVKRKGLKKSPETKERMRIAALKREQAKREATNAR